HHDQCSSLAEFDGEIAVGDGVQRVAADAIEAECFGDTLAIDGVCSAGQGSGTQWQTIDALASIDQAFGITSEHFGVCQQVVAEGNGLRYLEMSKTRQNGCRVLLGKRSQLDTQLSQQFDGDIDFVA